MSTGNPYAPPRSAVEAAAEDRAALREIVIAWERLRIVYNLLLLLPGLGIAALWIARTGTPVAAAAFGSALVAVGANLAFFLGPAAEVYLRGMFFRGQSIGRGRLLIFSAGLVVSGGVFLLALIPLLL